MKRNFIVQQTLSVVLCVVYHFCLLSQTDNERVNVTKVSVILIDKFQQRAIISLCWILCSIKSIKKSNNETNKNTIFVHFFFDYINAAETSANYRKSAWSYAFRCRTTSIFSGADRSLWFIFESHWQISSKHINKSLVKISREKPYFRCILCRSCNNIWSCVSIFFGLSRIYRVNLCALVSREHWKGKEEKKCENERIQSNSSSAQNTKYFEVIECLNCHGM